MLFLLKCCVFCLCGQPCVDISVSVCRYVHKYCVHVCAPMVHAQPHYLLDLGLGNCGLTSKGPLDLAASENNPNLSSECEDPGGNMNPLRENTKYDTSISFPLRTLEEGYEARTG